MSILGPGKGYITLLNEATTAKLQADKDSGKSYQKTPIRPSASGNCTKELYYELMQFHGKAKYDTEIINPETSRLFALGHSVEFHILKQFELLSNVFDIRYKQLVLSFKYLEAKNDPKLSQWLEGSLDMVFWSEKHKCVADVKSKKDKFSQFYKTAWDDMSYKLGTMRTVEKIGTSGDSFWVEDLEGFLEELNDPFFAGNFLQLNMYANSKFLLERGVDHGAIIQYSKNDSRLREIRFKPSAALYEKTVGKFQNALDAVDQGNPELAPRDYVLGSIKCAFCKFRKECWSEADATKAFYKTFPNKEWPRDTSRMGAVGAAVETLLATFRDQSAAEKDKKYTEQELVKTLLDAKTNKVRTSNGEIYEVKQLQSGLVIRRTKL